KVPRKFTESLLSRLRRSNQAPRKLSVTMPTRAAPIETASHCRRSSPPSRQTELTIPAAAMPANVPLKLTAPFVPAGTDFQLVISRGVSPKAGPISLEPESAAASERDDAIASSASL